MYTVAYYDDRTSVFMRSNEQNDLMSYNDIQKNKNTPMADGSKSFTYPSSVNDTLSLSFPPNGTDAGLNWPIAASHVWVPVYNADPDDDQDGTDHDDGGTESYPGTPGGDEPLQFSPRDVMGEIPPDVLCGGDDEDELTGDEFEGHGDVPNEEGGLTGGEFEGYDMPEEDN